MYSPYDNYCQEAQEKQSVPSAEAVLEQHPEFNNEKVAEARGNYYSCADNFEMGTIQDGSVYISTTNDQHDQICNGEAPTANGGLSGFFTDQETVDACSKDGVLDNTAYNEACQIKPHMAKGATEADYKPHVDCFDINYDKLEENYGTRDFNAAIGKCEANNQFGAGGGNQGYNPHVSEMIENGSLVHNPEKSYSDPSISNNENRNYNTLENSVVSETDYKDMMKDASARTDDCIKNNTPHPSEEVCKNTGVDVNKDLVDSKTGHATPVQNSEDMSCLYGQSDCAGKDAAPLQNNEDMSCLYNNANGTTNKDNLDLGKPANVNDYGVSL